MKFSECFKPRLFDDMLFRFVAIRSEVREWSVFEKYSASASNYELCVYINDFEITENFKYFVTADKWACKQILHEKVSCVIFRDKRDYALFKLMGFGEH